MVEFENKNEEKDVAIKGQEVGVVDMEHAVGECCGDQCGNCCCDDKIKEEEELIKEENEDTGIMRFAKEEMKLAGLDSPDSDYKGMLYNAVLELVKVFQKQGHSGMSAIMTLSIFKKVASWEPLTPITDTPESWSNNITQSGTMFQNIRDGRIFKDKDRFNGKPYTVDGRAFSYDGGECWYTNCKSHKIVNLPCMHPEKIRYIGTEEQIDNLTREQLEEMEAKNPTQTLFDLTK